VVGGEWWVASGGWRVVGEGGTPDLASTWANPIRTANERNGPGEDQTNLTIVRVLRKNTQVRFFDLQLRSSMI
jgi:hypothetical protein